VYKFYEKESAAWDALRQRLQEEANKKRSEAAKEQPRTEDGKRLAGGASFEAPPATKPPKNRTSTKKAKAAGVSHATAERAHAVVEHRPDLAEKVREGEITLNEATREMKREDTKKRLEDIAARSVASSLNSSPSTAA